MHPVTEMKLFYRTFFPRVPSKYKLALRQKADERRVTMLTSKGNYLLQRGEYLNDDDMEVMRQKVVRGR